MMTMMTTMMLMMKKTMMKRGSCRRVHGVDESPRLFGSFSNAAERIGSSSLSMAEEEI